MTETKTACPECGKDVAVNKDGTPRKHQCQPTREPATATALQEPGATPESPNEPVDEVEISTSTKPVVRSGRCYVARCLRPELNDGVGLCGAHYALRPELRKVARHG